ASAGAVAAGRASGGQIFPREAETVRLQRPTALATASGRGERTCARCQEKQEGERERSSRHGGANRTAPASEFTRGSSPERPDGRASSGSAQDEKHREVASGETDAARRAPQDCQPALAGDQKERERHADRDEEAEEHVQPHPSDLEAPCLEDHEYSGGEEEEHQIDR